MRPHHGGPTRPWKTWLGAMILALLVVTGRVLWDSREALQAAEEAVAKNDKKGAARHYLQAVRMYVPGSPFVQGGLRGLTTLAAQARAVGDRSGERTALESVRAGLLGARSLYVPHEDTLRSADARLAQLYAEGEAPDVDPGASLAARTAWHAARLGLRPGPASGAVVAALAGACLWLCASVLMFRRGLDRDLRIRGGVAAAVLAAFVVGFAMFVLGLRLA